MSKITVGAYTDIRDSRTYGKKIRVLDARTHRNIGEWYKDDVINRIVKDVKISGKYLFIFV